MFDAYLDIETTGLSRLYADITIIGIYLVNGSESRMVQLVGREENNDNLLKAVDGVNTLYTYNGSRFDLPFISGALGIDLETVADHHDLMYDCWRYNLFGGFKAVEQQLGILRQLKGIGGGRPFGLGRDRVRSLPDGVAQVLAEHLGMAEQVSKETAAEQLILFSAGDLCPECGHAALVNMEGCRRCYSCGYSDC